MSAAKLDPRSSTHALQGAGRDAPEAPLRDILRSVDAGELARAAEHSAQLLDLGVTDVRVLVYFSFGLFLERGALALPSIFGILTEAYGERWSALRPAVRLETLAATATSWLLRMVVHHLDFHARLDDEHHRAWRAEDARTLGGPALEAARRLREVMGGRVGTTRASDLLSEVEARVRAHFNRPAPPKPTAIVLTVVPPPHPAPEVEASGREEHGVEGRPRPAEGQPDAIDEKLDVGSKTETLPRDPIGPAASKAQGAERTEIAVPQRREAPLATIPISPAFEVFLRRLAAFEVLVERGELERAAVVASDIEQTLANFDPRTYFPKLLSPFFRLLSEHVEPLSEARAHLGEDRLRALSQLYSVDLEAFLEP
jgi:hypothetical protein